MKKPVTLWRSLEEFPPYYVRLLAKKPGSGYEDMALADTDIAIVAGLPVARVRVISQSTDWLTVTVGEIHAFCLACNFDPADPADRRRVRNYEYVCRIRKKRPFLWLKRSPMYETEFLPLLQLLSRRLTTPGTTARPSSVAAK